jgi:hypothetical protein
VEQVRTHWWLCAASGALTLAQLCESCGKRRSWSHPLISKIGRKADRAWVIASNQQPQTIAWTWGARRTVQSPWRALCEALVRIATQHGACNGNLSGERSNALSYLAIGHAQRIVLGSITASANTERESAGSNRIECRRDLCGEGWVPLRHIEHERANVQIRIQRESRSG